MKVIGWFVLIGWLVGCENPADNYVKRFEGVEILRADIPDSVNLNSIFLRAEAKADNGCWSNLYFELKKTRDFEYTLKAYGTYESFGFCPDELVTQDTLIYFQPTQLGTYIITTSMLPDQTVVDTMVVVE